MSNAASKTRRHQRRTALARLAGALISTILVVTGGCDRKASTKDSSPTTARAVDSKSPTAGLPRYEIDETLRHEYPHIVRFLEQFLETCLANDYAGYRKMVTRRVEPEPRDRFESIYRAIDRVVVASLRKIDPSGPVPELRGFEGPLFLAIARIELNAPPTGTGPAAATKVNRNRVRDIAIVIFEEDGDWRMAPAPSRYQPASEQPTGDSAQSQPTSKISYPWDESGDD